MTTMTEQTAPKERASALADAIQSCAAVLTWADALASRPVLDVDGVATLGRAIQSDARGAARHFTAAGAPCWAELIAPAVGIGEELTATAPDLREPHVRELAAQVTKAASDAQRHGLLAVGCLISVRAAEEAAMPTGAVLHAAQGRA